jgi:hypothetical protein
MVRAQHVDQASSQVDVLQMGMDKLAVGTKVEEPTNDQLAKDKVPVVVGEEAPIKVVVEAVVEDNLITDSGIRYF